MRKFSSYGPVDRDENYYVPRIELIERAKLQLLGKNPQKGGHYITVWAPRQTGKTWILQQVLWQLQKDERFEVLKLSLQHLGNVADSQLVIQELILSIQENLDKKFPKCTTWMEFQRIFTPKYFNKPLILIMDEFDSLDENVINEIAKVFRNIYMLRKDEIEKSSEEKSYLLHGVALIGVRSVLGIENKKGSPFNVQRSLHIPNLTYKEVNSLFQLYQKESSQKVEQEVIDHLYYELRGQPGLTCWFGELLTEMYNEDKSKTIDIKLYERVYLYASQLLPNNNILNIISKAKQEPYKSLVLEIFRTEDKYEFTFDDEELNFLYLNGVIDIEHVIEENGNEKLYGRFASPFIQKRLFNHFAREIFRYMGKLIPPFENIDDAITETNLNIRNLMKRYQQYLQKNREWLFKEAPRRIDMRLYEAVYHFNIYQYLYNLLKSWQSQVYPEFPTGNGKIDIVIKHGGKLYGIELKSYATTKQYQDALIQAAKYGKKLGLKKVSLIFFVEEIDSASRIKYEQDYEDKEGKVIVEPIFIATME